ncbi:MAG: hypothetical protein AAF456_06165 [Planctomycetota bacterium]
MFGLIWKSVLPTLLVGGVLFAGHRMSRDTEPVFEVIAPEGLAGCGEFEVQLDFVDDSVDYHHPALPAQNYASHPRCFFRLTGPFDWIEGVDVWLRADGQAPVRIPVSVRMLNDSCSETANGLFTFVDRNCAAQVDFSSLDNFDVAVRIKASVDNTSRTLERNIQFRIIRPGILD